MGRPALFATTRQFLDDLGLQSLDQLPMLEEPESQQSLFKALEESGASQMCKRVRQPVTPRRPKAGVRDEVPPVIGEQDVGEELLDQVPLQAMRRSCRIWSRTVRTTPLPLSCQRRPRARLRHRMGQMPRVPQKLRRPQTQRKKRTPRIRQTQQIRIGAALQAEEGKP